jgi:hypothetical protein
MSTANKIINTTELDFDTIKSNLKTFLKGQSQFADYDFEGAGLSVLIDLLAYNTHYNALYTNLAINESFLDSASKRSSVVSRAKEIGYVPYSSSAATATVNIVVSSTTSTPATLTMPAYSSFSTSIDGEQYTFYTTESITTTLVGSTYTFTNVNIKEGTPLTFKYTVADGTQYIIPNQKVDMSTLAVRVQDNATSSNFTTWINQELILNLDSESKVYFIKEIEGQFKQLEFGNGVIGKALSNGNVVNLTYLVTNEDAGNGARVFTYTGSTLLGGSVAVTTVTPAAGGAVAETIDSIRYNAPRAYAAQNRAVTVEDYKTMIFRLYPEAQTINVWGGEDNDPPTYGKVFLSVKPTTTDILTQNQKDYIINSILKEKNVVSITPEIVDPEYINLQVNCSVYYNPRLTTKSENTLKSLVVQTIKDYNTDNLNSFTGVFRHSNLSTLIDSTEDAIVSNITTIKLHREIDVQYNTNANYIINLANPIYGSGVPEQSITSHGFYIAGNDNIVYIEDLPTDHFTGQLRLFYFSNTGEKVYIRTFGSVDYPNGIIRLTELEITGIDLTQSPVLELIIKPQSNDVVSIRNQLVTIPDENITVNVILDKVSVGDPGGGTNYIFTSSRN